MYNPFIVYPPCLQVGKAKTVKATSPRTLVIIGKQQPTVESDNEEIQVHYKEPTRSKFFYMLLQLKHMLCVRNSSVDV